MNPEEIPILKNKYFDDSTVFTPEGLLREARRQKALPQGKVPDLCILDPDGDIVHNLFSKKRALLNPDWACYHTDLLDFSHEGMEFGIIGCTVGAPFAVLVAEELFASGCRLLISITSAGQILPVRNPPSKSMARIARKRGIKTYEALAEKFPFIDESFDFVLMVTTICFLKNPFQAFQEVRRVLKPEDLMIIGTLDRDSCCDKEYESQVDQSHFYHYVHSSILLSKS